MDFLFLNTDFHISNILLYHSLIYSAKVISSTLMYLLFKSIPLMIIMIIGTSVCNQNYSLISDSLVVAMAQWENRLLLT